MTIFHKTATRHPAQKPPAATTLARTSELSLSQLKAVSGGTQKPSGIALAESVGAKPLGIALAE